MTTAMTRMTMRCVQLRWLTLHVLQELPSVNPCPWHFKPLCDSELRQEDIQHLGLSQNIHCRALEHNLGWYRRRRSRHRVLSARHLSLPRRCVLKHRREFSLLACWCTIPASAPLCRIPRQCKKGLNESLNNIFQ